MDEIAIEKELILALLREPDLFPPCCFWHARWDFGENSSFDIAYLTSRRWVAFDGEKTDVCGWDAIWSRISDPMFRAQYNLSREVESDAA